MDPGHTYSILRENFQHACTSSLETHNSPLHVEDFVGCKSNVYVQDVLLRDTLHYMKSQTYYSMWRSHEVIALQSVYS